MSTPESSQDKSGDLPKHPENLANTVAEWLANQIIEGKLRPGEKLNIRELAERFNFSPTPIREALRSLEAEGLVELSPNRSPTVTRITEKQVRDIYVCRAHLMGLCARLATEHMDAQSLALLNQIVAEMADAVQQNDTPRYFQLSTRFNDELARLSDNQVLIDLLNSLGRRTLRLRNLAVNLPGQIQRGLDHHLKIMTAINANDAELAGVLTCKMLEGSRDLILGHNLSNEI
jgi:DNA-binding GntR family transcriptional regulator